jgi:hypothetical protein
MKYHLSFLLLLSLHSTSLNGLLISGDTMTVKAGSININSLVHMSHQFKILRGAYIITTAAIIAYLVYDKIKRDALAEEKLTANHQ